MDPEKVESRAEAAAAGAEGAEPFAVSDEALPGDDEGDDEPLAHPICAATFDDPVYAVSAHPTAPIIAAGHGGDGVCVWDARTGQLLMQADKVHSDSVTTVGFSRDGKYLASASLDHSLRVWKVRQTPPVLPAVAAAVASADGPAAAASSSVAVAAGDASRTTWEIVSGLRRKKKGKKRATKAQAGSKSTPKGNTTTEEPDSSLKLGYPEPLVLEGPSEDVEWMAWHPTGPALLCGSADCTAWLYDVSSGECLSVLAGHEGAVTAGTFDGKGKLAVTASDDGSLRVWAPGTGECKLVVRGGGWFPPGEPVVSIVAHQSKPIVLAGGVDGTARLVNISTGKVLGKLDHSLAAGKVLEAAAAKQAADQAAAIDRAMTRLAEAKAAGDEDVEIDLMAEMDAAKAEPPTASEATAATSGSGGDDSASATGALQGAATAAAQEEEEEEEEEGLPSIEGVGFCTLEGMQLAATGGSDGSLRVWDLSTFRPRAACKQEGSIVRLEWHPSEPAVVTCSSDGSIRAFDARDGTTLVVMPAHSALCLDMQLAVWQRPPGEPEPAAKSESLEEEADAEAAAGADADEDTDAAAVAEAETVVVADDSADDTLQPIPWGEVVVVSGGDDCRIALLELGV